VYSQNGTFRKPTGILEIKDKNGKILEEYKDNGYNVVFPEVAGKINSILSDNNARARTFGYTSPLYVSDEVAVKTGTTNNYRDGWIIGYTTNTVVGAWIGKNDNTPLGDTAAATSIAPMWNQIFRKILQKTPAGELNKNYSVNQDLAGLKCINGIAQDIIHTAVYSGMFSHIDPTDGQLQRWSHSSSYCAPKVVEEIIEGLGSTATGSNGQQIQIQVAPINGQTNPPNTNNQTNPPTGNVQIQNSIFQPGIPVNPSNPTQLNVQQ
jgi:membrane peptidoglycan carboxypeptidase